MSAAKQCRPIAPSLVSTHPKSTLFEIKPCPFEESNESSASEFEISALHLISQRKIETIVEKSSTTIDSEESKHPIVLDTITTKNIIHEDIQTKVISERKGWLRNTLRCYYELWKTKLSLLVVLTAIGGFYSTGGAGGLKALAVTVGTFLQAGCANSFNEIIEVERDKIMARTKNRPLCTNRISKFHAILQAVTVGAAGTWLLYKLTNPLTALLGLANIIIYTSVYTPSKVMHPINTWIGTLNGSLPPLMGCTAATNTIFHPTGMYMFLALYLWQIVHFMAISYKCGKDYAKAGYQMLSIYNPDSAAWHAVVHAGLLFPLCWALPFFGISPWFALLTTPINYYLLFKPAWKFKKEVNYTNATSLFFKSLGHLSLLFGIQVVTFCWKPITNWIKSWFTKN